MKKAMSLLTATAMAATLLAGCGGGAASSSAAPAADSTSTEASSTAAEPAADAAAEEGKVLNIWCWNDEFQSRFNDYYPGVKEIAADKSTTTLDNGVTVKITTTTRISWTRPCSSRTAPLPMTRSTSS